MTDVPDAWPPTISPVPVPMFPLPGVFLFPRQPLPLHVFEPRYRKMVEDSLDGPGRIVLATIPEGESEPAVLDVGGLGEIARHDRLEDGRFLIVLFGLARVELEEVESEEPYRQARIVPLAEIAESPEVARRLDPRLREAIHDRVASEVELPDEVPLDALIDLLCTQLKLPAREMERIFTERDVARRAELALAAHARKGE